MKNITKITSAKVITDLYDKFRIACITEKNLTYQKLVNISLFLYENNNEYNNIINSSHFDMKTGEISLSGSVI